MTLLKNILSIAAFAIAANSSAQDLIARQATADRALTTISSVSLDAALDPLTNSDLQNPAAHIYATWEHKNLRNSQGYLPANSKVDLRGYCMPTDSRKITSNFGWRWRRQHEGIDVKVYIGDTIRAAFDGKVRIVEYNRRGYGYYVVIRHPNGLETLYGHLSKQLVQNDQIVRAGQPIGLGGNTGRSTGSHLHFETRICGTPINPALMFDFENQDVVSDYYTTNRSYGTPSAVGNTTTYLALNEQATEDNGTGTQANTPTNSTTTKATTKNSNTKSRRTYTVKKGDTLSAIAKRNGTTVKHLCQVNGIKSTQLLQIGQRIKL